MLKKENRLTSFSLPSAKNISTPYYSLKYIKNNSAQSRFGFIVSKKVSTSAVIRNSSKRKLRSVIEANLASITQGYDLAFYLKKEIIDAEKPALEASLLSDLKKEGLFYE